MMKIKPLPSDSSSRSSLLDRTWVCLTVLAVQHLAIFWQHYVGRATFLNDFARIFYPMNAFWVTLVQHGIFPEWTPFQTMGMPFVLTMQSGVFYPPLWLFALVKVPFTLHLAAVVQTLHVLWGAVGCWCYLRLLGKPRDVALFGAIAFQFFGGFYSNAEHIDMVRAFAWLPWLFWSVQVLPQQMQPGWRNGLAPLIVCCFVTGSYQGNLVSHSFMLGVFMLFCCVTQCVQQPSQWRQRMTLHGQSLLLFALGVALASVYLLPTIALKNYLARDGVWTHHTMDWPLAYWNTLVMASDAEGLFVLPSMLSGFVTVPVFCLLFLVARPVIRQNGSWVFLSIVAWIMASGNHSVIYRAVVALFPPLGTSRFPSSDYRAILGFGLIVLASGVLDIYLNAQQVVTLARRCALCLGLLLFFDVGSLLTGWLDTVPANDTTAWMKQHDRIAPAAGWLLKTVGQNTLSAPWVEWQVTIVLVCLVFASLAIFRKKPSRLLAAMLVLEMISGFYFVECIALYWRSDVATDTFYQELDASSPYTVLQTIEHPASTRPACHDMNLFHGSWRGYLLGDYMCQTQDSKTRPREVIRGNPVLDRYMRQGWQAHAVTPEQLGHCEPETMLQSQDAASPVQTTAYGLQSVRYHVAAANGFCFVENELMFPGWSGSIAGHRDSIEPHTYCGALRSWCLPPGDYDFIASYRAPWLREGAGLSLVFLAIYLGGCAWCFYTGRQRMVA